MRILSNAFPTNMPDSEKISQGGPANFAKFFQNYLITNTKHSWVGLIFNNTPRKTIKCQKIYSFQQRDFYRMQMPVNMLRAIVKANKKRNPELVLEKPIKKIVGLIKSVKPDIIFLNGFGIYNWMLLKAGEITKTPIVIQHAGIWTKELRIHGNLYSVYARKMMEQMEKDSTRIVSHEVFLNDWSRKYYNRTVTKIDPDKTSNVPLPFDFNAFKKISSSDNPDLFDFSKKKVHFGTIARWDKIKNHKAILAMAKKAKQENLPWVFHSVVDIPESGKYSKGKKKYEKYVDVIPPLDRSGIFQFCKAVDILILPSIFDVSPTVVLEAFASATPIIISPNVGFGGEFETHGGNKWIIDFSNIDLAIKEIKKLVGKKMPKLLIKEIHEKHQSKEVFDQYINIFKTCIAKKKR